MTFADAPDVLTIPEAAALARIGRNAMYQAVERGDIYAARIGRSLRIPKAALARFLGIDSLPPVADAGPVSGRRVIESRGGQPVIAIAAPIDAATTRMGAG